MKDPADDICEVLREQSQDAPKGAPVVRVPLPHEPHPNDDPPPNAGGKVGH